MALPNGDLITTVFDPQMAYPVDKRMQVDTLNSRDSISMYIRWEGMTVYVLEDSKIYILQGGRSNEYWKELGTGTGTGGTTFVGQFATADLLPTSGRSAGDYAFVGTGDDFVQYNWDNIANEWVMAEGQTDMASEFFHIGYKTPLRRPVIFPLFPKDVLVETSGDFVFAPEISVARFIFTGEVEAIRGIETAAADREIKLVNRTGSDIPLRDKASGIPSGSGMDFGGTDYTWLNGSEITLKGNGTYWELAPNNQVAFSDHLDSVNAIKSTGPDGSLIISGIQDKNTGENVEFKQVSKYSDNSTMDDTKVDGTLYAKVDGVYYKRVLKDGFINAKYFGLKGDNSTYDQEGLFELFTVVGNMGGGKIMFPPAIYRLNSLLHRPVGESEMVIPVPANTEIYAEGATFTAAYAFCFRFNFENVRWTGGKIIKGRIETKASNLYIKDVRVERSWSNSFHLSGGKSEDINIVNKLYKNITLENCFAYRSDRHGFAIHRGSYSFSGATYIYMGVYEDIKFINCTALESSYKEDGTWASIYDYGFGIEFVVSAKNIYFEGCISDGAPSAGWHTETIVPTENIQFLNCVSRNNGRGLVGYPCGYFYKSGWHFTNCKAYNNISYNWAHEASFDGGNYSFVDCESDGKRFSFNPTDNLKYELNFDANAEMSGAWAYVMGSSYMPVKGFNRDYFEISTDDIEDTDPSGVAYIKSIPVVNSTVVVWGANERRETLASTPIKVDINKKYEVKVTAKQLSGTTGNLVLYIQEYDKDNLLIKRGNQYWLYKHTLSTITTGSFNTETIFFGKRYDVDETHIEFYPQAVWVRASLVFVDDSSSNKLFSVSEFSVNPLDNNTSTTGATTFPELTDTPANYTGHKNKSVKVNNEETALVFVADGVDVRNITDGGSIAPTLTDGFIGSRLNFTSSTAVTLQGFTSAGGQSSVTLVNPHATNNLTLVHNGAGTVKYIDAGATDLVIAPKTAVKVEIVGNEIYRVL